MRSKRMARGNRHIERFNTLQNQEIDYDRLESIVRDLSYKCSDLEAAIGSARNVTEDIRHAVNKANEAAGWIASEVSRMRHSNIN